MAGLPVVRALADAPAQKDDAFIFIHAYGGWDVTLWSDPRNAKQGIVNPASDRYVDTNGVRHWTNKPLGDGTNSFEVIQRNGFALGPGLGGLIDMFSRVTVVNGLAMETVSHPDGTYYSATGRHLAGGRPLQTSLDTILASELGATDLLPLMSINFPSTLLSPKIDARATPLRIADVTAVGRSLARSEKYTQAEDRRQLTALLANESALLAKNAYDPTPADHARLQYEALGRMLGDPSTLDTFDDAKLRTTLQPGFFVDAGGQKIERQFFDKAAVDAAFAVEAIKRRMVRCVSFGAGSFDMHGTEYQDAALKLQELFDLVATLIQRLDAEGLSNRVHIMVISEFCRTPQINAREGRDHYPNNSALVVSPRFRGGRVYGSTDHDELLPSNVVPGPNGNVQLRPSDLLATMLGAMAIEPRKYLRDGDVVKDLLA